jgi:hypothetical protein
VTGADRPCLGLIVPPRAGEVPGAGHGRLFAL